VENSERQEPTRRDFLGKACVASTCAAGAVAAVPIVSYLKPLPSVRPTGPVDVGPDALGDSGAAALPVGPLTVLIIRHGGRLTAVNATCTHLGCLVKWDEKAKLIRCPCHSATFEADGTQPSLPAPRPLPSYPVRSEKGRLIVVFS
jgi:cytochrome b6-f complex iron-sulfur subunit